MIHYSPLKAVFRSNGILSHWVAWLRMYLPCNGVLIWLGLAMGMRVFLFNTSVNLLCDSMHADVCDAILWPILRISWAVIFACSWGFGFMPKFLMVMAETFVCHGCVLHQSAYSL
jgi:hypothetical protein